MESESDSHLRSRKAGGGLVDGDEFDLEDDEELEDNEEEEPAQILYDLITYREWEQEPEIIKQSENRHRGTNGQGLPWMSRLWGSQPTCPLPPTVDRILSYRLNWQFVVSHNAAFVAVLQDTVLEVWNSKDNYGTLVGRRGLPKDPAPAWRHLAWSEDCSLLAVAFSNGVVEVSDTLGALIYRIISPQVPASQPSFTDTMGRTGPSQHTYVSIFFTNVRIKDKKWTSELILVDVSGRVVSFLVSLSGYQEFSDFRVGWDLTAAIHSPTHNLLITAGSSPLCGKSSLLGRASHAGLLAFRLINDVPHYLSIMDEEEQSVLLGRPFKLPFFSPAPQDHVVKMAVTSCGRRLATIHESGSISVWSMPGLLVESVIQLGEQPSFDEVNPQLLQAPNKKKVKGEFLANTYKFHPTDLSWWNREALTLARVSGAISVVHTENLSNLLGDSPEFLEGVPSLSQTFEKGFFALECEWHVRGRRQSVREVTAGEDPDLELEEDSDEDDESSWITLGKRSASAVAYFLTDNERFAPPKKKSKVVKKTYRLLALVSTTPAELFDRKIASEEYGEALMLAQLYRLDTDAVYERQWKLSNKSVAAIHDYLGKIKRRVTVIKECLEIIPEDIDAARELLQYGLNGTDLEALAALNNGADSGDFVLCRKARMGTGAEYEDWYEDDDGHPPLSREEREREARVKLTAKVHWQSLTLVQKDLIASRLRFLYYLDVLDTYEDMLGGGHLAAERFQPHVFRKLRSKNPLENCVMAARNSDNIGVAALLSNGRHGAHTLPHWLPILSCFPETTPPEDYQDLLPAISMEGTAVPWIQQVPRPDDWAEQPLAAKYSGHGNSGGFLRQAAASKTSSDPSAALYVAAGGNTQREYMAVGGELTPRQVSRWYEERARTIASLTSVPELALQLLQKGLERDVEIDPVLVNNLRTLDALVYEVQLDINIDELEKLNHMEQMKRLMSESEDQLKDIRGLLMPYLQRLEDVKIANKQDMLLKFCLEVAKDDLGLILVIIENSGPTKHGAILHYPKDIVRLALDSIYAHETGKQLDIVHQIYECVADYFDPPASRGLHMPDYHLPYTQGLNRDEYIAFTRHFDAAKIVARSGIYKPLSLFRDSGNDLTAMEKVFEAITRRAEGARPPLDQDGWRAILRDIQRLQKLIPIVPIRKIFYSYCESLLSSGLSSNISLAGDVLRGMVETDDQISLVKSAWTHYYSTSSSVLDPNLDLARQVLGLLPTAAAARDIQVCSDLISALQSLSDFGLGDVHPVSVLKSNKRLDFVVKALEVRSGAYRNTQRLMKLATLLHVSDSQDEIEGLVWSLVARKSLEAVDYLACLVACNNLIQSGFSSGWDVCYALAVQAQFEDVEKSHHLLAFALTHCDPKNIDAVINSLLKVEQNAIHKDLNLKASKLVIEDVDDGEENGLKMDDDGDVEDNFHDSLEEQQNPSNEARSREMSPGYALSAARMTKSRSREVSPGSMLSASTAAVASVGSQLLNVTSLSRQYLVDNELSRAVWHQTTGLLSAIGSNYSSLGDGGSAAEKSVTMAQFEKVTVPAFYLGLFQLSDQVDESSLCWNYRDYRWSRSGLVLSHVVSATQQILRSELISQVLLNSGSSPEETSNISTELQSFRISIEVLQRLVPAVASQDLLFGLSLALCAQDDASVRRTVLCGLPHSITSLSFALLYLSVDLLLRLGIDAGTIFKSSPTSIIKSSIARIKGLEDERSCAIREYLEMMADHRQAGLLSHLAGEVNVSRFTQDKQYKLDTILGLARFLEADKWEFTCSLAKRYKLNMWTVAATHIEAAFTDLPASTERSGSKNGATEPLGLAELIESRGLVAHLVTDSNGYESWAKERILPLLCGTDHSRLQLYYSVLHQVTDKNDWRTYADAVAILKRTSCHDVDFFAHLLKGGSLESATLSEVITGANIQHVVEAVTKLATVVAMENADQENGDDAVMKSSPRLLLPGRIYTAFAEAKFFEHGGSTDNWIEAFSVCLEHAEKLGPEDFQELTRSCILSEMSLGRVPRPARGRIFKKAVKHVEIKRAEKAAGDWAAVQGWLDGVRQHADKFKSALSVNLMKELKESDHLFVDRLELTGGNEADICRLLATLVINGHPQTLIEKLITLWYQDESKVEEGLIKVFNSCVNTIDSANSEQSYEVEESVDCICQLVEAGLSSVSSLQPQLAKLCTNEVLSLPQRLNLVKVLKLNQKASRGLKSKEASKEESKAKTESKDNEDSQNEENGSPEQSKKEDGDHDEAQATDEEELEESGLDFDTSFLSELYEIQQVVQSFLPNFEVKKDDLSNETTKVELMQRLLDGCRTQAQLTSLAKFYSEYSERLLGAGSEQQQAVKPLIKQILLNSLELVSKIQDGSDHNNEAEQNGMDAVISLMQENEAVLDSEAVTEVLNRSRCDPHHFTILVFSLKKEDQYSEAMGMLEKISEPKEDLLVEVINCGLGGKLATSPHYSRLAEAALGAGLAEPLIEQLKADGRHLLAVSLQMTVSGVPMALRNLASLAHKMSTEKSSHA